MSKMNLKTMKKTTKSNLITYAMVIVIFAVVQILVATGSMSSLMQGLLVPLCTYSIVAIGLNLCVGYLGELSLGHAGFMCVGAFSSAFFTRCMENSSMNPTLRFIIALLIGTAVAAFFGFINRNSGTSFKRRLPCNRNPGIWRDYQECHQCSLYRKR